MPEAVVISLIDMPEALETALREQAARLPEGCLLAANGGDAAVLAASGEAAPLCVYISGSLPGGRDKDTGAFPVLRLTPGQPLRLGNVLAHLGRALRTPALYTDPCRLADGVFYPQEKFIRRESGEEARLTEREADILLFLLQRQQSVVSRQTLLSQVWKYNEGVDTHTLETHIYRLRQKLQALWPAADLLQTSEGGYRLHVDLTAH